jgi:hypothetical protein
MDCFIDGLPLPDSYRWIDKLIHSNRWISFDGLLEKGVARLYFLFFAGDGDGGSRRRGYHGVRHHALRDPVQHGALAVRPCGPSYL